MINKTKKAGRPVQEKKASARVEFRVEDDHKEHWQAFAKKQGLKLSAWIKQIADKESGFTS